MVFSAWFEALPQAQPVAHLLIFVTQFSCHTSACGFVRHDVTRPVRSGRRAFECVTLRVGAHPA